jgi:hypothetical protein
MYIHPIEANILHSDSQIESLQGKSRTLVDISKDVFTSLESFGRPCPPQELRDSIEHAFKDFKIAQTKAQISEENNDKAARMHGTASVGHGQSTRTGEAAQLSAQSLEKHPDKTVSPASTAYYQDTQTSEVVQTSPQSSGKHRHKESSPASIAYDQGTHLYDNRAGQWNQLGSSQWQYDYSSGRYYYRDGKLPGLR